MVNKTRLRRVISVLREREYRPEVRTVIDEALQAGRVKQPVSRAMAPLIQDVKNLGDGTAAEVAFALFLVIEGAGAWEQVGKWAKT